MQRVLQGVCKDARAQEAQQVAQGIRAQARAQAGELTSSSADVDVDACDMH